MARFAVCIYAPLHYPHSEAFAEVAESLVAGLHDLGHQADLVRVPSPVALNIYAERTGARCILLGSNLLARFEDVPELPPDTILYNLEQVDADSTWFTPTMRALLKKHEVWDYSAVNVTVLASMNITAKHVPIAYHPVLSRITPADEQDIEVLFYGSINPRRAKVIGELLALDIRVETAFGVYGAARDSLIARSKVVLNMHFYEAKVFEIVRCSYLFANRVAVVSETGNDESLERPFLGTHFACYEDLADACDFLLGFEKERLEGAQYNYDAFRAQPNVADVLQRALYG